MAARPVPDDELTRTVAAFEANGRNQSATAFALGIGRQTLQSRLRDAARRGMMGTKPVLPGFRISQTTITPSGGEFIQQKPEHGEQFEVPAGHSMLTVARSSNG